MACSAKSEHLGVAPQEGEEEEEEESNEDKEEDRETENETENEEISNQRSTEFGAHQKEERKNLCPWKFLVLTLGWLLPIVACLICSKAAGTFVSACSECKLKRAHHYSSCS